jgi:hypothetical protein
MGMAIIVMSVLIYVVLLVCIGVLLLYPFGQIKSKLKLSKYKKKPFGCMAGQW